MRNMAKDIQISEASIQKIVKKQIKLHPYKLAKVHLLMDKMKGERLKRSRKMRRLAAAGRHRSILFTDENIFTVEQHNNSQNDRQLLSKGSSNPQTAIRSHF